jgi:hypothetical protein
MLIYNVRVDESSIWLPYNCLSASLRPAINIGGLQGDGGRRRQAGAAYQLTHEIIESLTHHQAHTHTL